MLTLSRTYPFSEADFKRAYEEWGCNCGPTALAFALGKQPDDVRPLIPGFDEKRYTSPSMMKAALANAGQRFVNFAHDPLTMYHERISLTRIQWTGPWTKPGANPKWAYRQTHWVATWNEQGVQVVFDCNGGIMPREDWESQIVPLIVAQIPRADGGWFPTHVWRLEPQSC